MNELRRLLCFAVLLPCVVGIASGQEIRNWAAPPFFSLDGAKPDSKGEVSPVGAEAVEGVPTPPLHFVALSPCRLVDTRGNGFTGAYGPPQLTAGVPRSFVLTGRCGISGAAEAVSLNVTVTNTQGPGFIKIYPQGAAEPTVSTLNYVAGQTIANAAVVPLGAGGGITVIAGVSGTDLILDTNGDYRGGVVTGVQGLSGNVTLDSNFLFISTEGQSVSLDAGPGGVLPAGTEDQTLRHNGTSWVANSFLTIDGFDEVGVNSAALLFTPTVRIRANIGGLHYPFMNNVGGSNNTFLGQDAGFGDCCAQGDNNTGIGALALNSINVGSANNTAVGYNTMPVLSTGSGNIAIGTNIAPSLTSGSNNLYIGNPGAGNESGQIRIGTNAVHTQGTVIASIHGFGSAGGIPVIVNSGGRLGTTTSSVRVKENVRGIGAESEGLLSLRPVAFKYKTSHEPGGLTQYGLIAEEVAEIYPELIVYDDEGRPQAIRSQLLDPLLLNEVQKQRQEIDELKARLAKLESCNQ